MTTDKCIKCGTELQKGWHVDHANPVERKTKTIGGTFITKDNKQEPTEKDFENGNYEFMPTRRVPNGFRNPQNHTIENMMPSCASCNINKHSMDIEQFRGFISRFIASLNKTSVIYKVAKRYGLIEETGKPVIFYFETLQEDITIT